MVDGTGRGESVGGPDPGNGASGVRGHGPGRRRAPRRGPRRRGRLRRVLTWVAAVTSGFVLLTSVSGYALLSHYEHRIKRIDVFRGIHDTPRRTTTEAQNYLIVGSDSRQGLTHAQIRRLHLGRDPGRRTDTMIIAHVSKQHDKVTMVSLPRDSLVTIPAHTTSSGTKVAAHKDKINAAYAYGGPKLAVRTVQNATGIAIDHYVEVNFTGFIGVVDALGTVPVCVPTDVHDSYSGLDLTAGRHDLGGTQALRYVRARHIDARGDLGRIERQQKFIGAMAHEALSAGTLLNPLKLKHFLDAALDTVSTDPGLSRTDIIRLATTLRSLDPAHVTFVTVPLSNVDYRGLPSVGSAVLWDDKAATSLFTDIRDDRPIGGSPTTGPTTVQVAPGNIHVQVTGAASADLTATATDDLRSAGFAVAAPPKNATTSAGTETVIRYDPRWSSSVQTVQAVLPGARTEKVTGQGGVFQIVVGSGYRGLHKITVKTTPPGGTSVQARSAADNVCS